MIVLRVYSGGLAALMLHCRNFGNSMGNCISSRDYLKFIQRMLKVQCVRVQCYCLLCLSFTITQYHHILASTVLPQDAFPVLPGYLTLLKVALPIKMFLLMTNAGGFVY